jgi:RND family efflux transporter MFP subunit
MDTQASPKKPDISELIIPDKGRWSAPPPASSRGRALRRGAAAFALALLAGAAWMFRGEFFAPVVGTVTVQLPSAAEMDSVLTASGYVLARREASLGPRASGTVAWVGVEEGSRVAKGQVLARLEARELGAQMEEMKATVAQDEREVERLKSLASGGFTAGVDLERAENRLEVDRAKLALVEAQIENTLVRAPFDGVVTRRDMEVGEPISYGAGAAGTAVLRVVDMDSLEVQADVSEGNVARLREGQPARVRVDAMLETSFEGRLRQVIPTADRQKGTVEVRVSILEGENPGDRARLLPESAAQVTFMRFPEERQEAAPQTTLAVPAAALVESQGSRGWIFVIQDGVARRREVEIFSRDESAARLRGGLTDGDVVATEGAESLRDGQKVRVAEKK